MNTYMQILEYDKILEKLEKFCISSKGKTLCKNLLPIFNYDKVILMQQNTNEMYNLTVKKGSIPISDFSDIDIYLKSLEIGSSLNIKALLDIAKILKLSRTLKEFYEEEDFSSLNNTFENIYSNIGIETRIFKCILDENTISDDASIPLKKIRQKLYNSTSQIKENLNAIIRSHQKHIMEPIVTIRNDRFVIPIKEEYKHEIKGFIHDISSSGSTVFIEPISVFELNNQINNLKAEETIEIENILSELSGLLIPIKENLEHNTSLLAFLDLLNAKVKFSMSTCSVPPNITKEKEIVLNEARHPLIDTDKVIPINISIGTDFTSLIITGPNTGRKNSYFKNLPAYFV